MRLSWTIILTCTYVHAQEHYTRNFNKLPIWQRSSMVYDSYPEWPTFAGSSLFEEQWEDSRGSMPIVPIYQPLTPFDRKMDGDQSGAILESYQNQPKTDDSQPSPTRYQMSTKLKPPPYSKSLENIDDFTSEVNKRIKSKNGENNTFITMIYIIQRLGKEVYENGWRYFDTNYMSLIEKFIKNANEYPQMATEHVKCILGKTQKKIKSIRKLLNSTWVDHMCKVPLGCDILIDSVVKIVAEDALYRQAVQLLLLGDEASGYLKMSPLFFDSLRKNDLYVFFMNSKDTVGLLMFRNAMVRQTNPSLSSECPL